MIFWVWTFCLISFFNSIWFTGIMMKSYIYWNYSLSFGWYVIGACDSYLNTRTSVSYLVFFKFIVNWFRVCSSHDMIYGVCVFWDELGVLVHMSEAKMMWNTIYQLSRIKLDGQYCQTSNIRCTLGNEIVDHSNVVGASPVGTAPTTSSFSIEHLASMVWTETTARWYEKHLSFGFCVLY